MMGKTHILIGAVTGLGLAVKFNYPVDLAAVLTVAAAAGALLPDIDHPKGMIRQKMGLLGWPLSILPHRGPTHSLLALLLVGVVAMTAFWSINVAAINLQPYMAQIAAGVVIGYWSHLLADMITVEGIPLMFPLSRQYISVLPIRTGSIFERIIALLVTIAGGYFVYLLLT